MGTGGPPRPAAGGAAPRAGGAPAGRATAATAPRPRPPKLNGSAVSICTSVTARRLRQLDLEPHARLLRRAGGIPAANGVVPVAFAAASALWLADSFHSA